VLEGFASPDGVAHTPEGASRPERLFLALDQVHVALRDLERLHVDRNVLATGLHAYRHDRRVAPPVTLTINKPYMTCARIRRIMLYELSAMNVTIISDLNFFTCTIVSNRTMVKAMSYVRVSLFATCADGVTKFRMVTHPPIQRWFAYFKVSRQRRVVRPEQTIFERELRI